MLDIATYLKGLHYGLDFKGSQPKLVEAIFSACDSNHFSLTYESNSSQKSLFKTSPLSKNMKMSFPDQFPTEKLSHFLEAHIPDSAGTLMSKFGINPESPFRKKYLALSLAEQFRMFVESNNKEVPSVVASHYQNYLDNPEADSEISLVSNLPIHAGDSVELINPMSGGYKKNTNQTFKHQWKLKNSGKTEWLNRKLSCINIGEKAIRVKANPSLIDINKTKPGEFVTIRTEFDSRGFEGQFRTIWKMIDSNNKDCFPNLKWIFDVTIEVIFTPED